MSSSPGVETNNPEDRQIQVRWGPSTDLKTIFANQIIVTHATRTEFFITFGELAPPTEYFGTQEHPDSIEVRPVARIAVAPEAMRQFIDALVDNMERFGRNQGLVEGTEGDEVGGEE